MNMSLDIAYLLHRHRCKKCNGRKPCVEGWREFNDAAQTVARTYDAKRAKA